MKKLYITPEMEIEKFTLKDVILASIEGSIPEIIGPSIPDPGDIDDVL